jgi:hypothetical protein
MKQGTIALSIYKTNFTKISAGIARLPPCFIEIEITFKFNTQLVDSDYAMMEYSKRTLVAIGTHDLDTLRGPFSYEVIF